MQPHNKSRTQKAITNDSLIRQAGITEVLRVGVDHLSLREVSARAGLTHGATYARYEDAEELLVDLWINILMERSVRLYELCQNAARHPSNETLQALFQFVLDASEADAAAVHLLFTARRIPVLAEEVDLFIASRLRFDAQSSDESAVFTRGICLYGLMTTQILYAHHVKRSNHYLEQLKEWLVTSLQVPPRDVTRIDVTEPRVNYLDVTSDDLRSELAMATFNVIGSSGYTRATISRIARRAGCSPGAIYGLYDSKEALVVASYQKTFNERWSRITQFTRFLDVGFLTQLLFDCAHPTNAVWRNFLLEFSLASAHNPLLFQSHEVQERGLAALAPNIPEATDEELILLGQIITVLSLITHGVSFVASVLGSMEFTDFDQFAEPLRQSILWSAGPTWTQLCSRVNVLAGEFAN